MKRFIISVLIVAAAAVSFAGQMPKYGVTVKTDKKADFTRLKSYTWQRGWQAYDQAVDLQILAAVEQELRALGFEKRESPPSDVVMMYASVLRTDIDVHAKPLSKGGTHPEFMVGTLVVLMLESSTRKQLFQGRMDARLDAEHSTIEEAIDAGVVKMFAKYPIRRALQR
jgi:hypothetical protein